MTDRPGAPIHANESSLPDTTTRPDTRAARSFGVGRSGRTDRPARIAAAAREILLRRGFRGITVAEIARRAGVGKGTVYLYWDTKEDLFLDLLTRDLHAVNDAYTAEVQANSDAVRPSRASRFLMEVSLRYPLSRALQDHDTDALGALLDDPRVGALLELTGPSALTNIVLPVWREHGLVADDRPVEEQGFALSLLFDGFVRSRQITRPDAITVDDPFDALARAVTIQVGERTPPREQVDAAAADTLTAMARLRETIARIEGPTSA